MVYSLPQLVMLLMLWFCFWCIYISSSFSVLCNTVCTSMCFFNFGFKHDVYSCRYVVFYNSGYALCISTHKAVLVKLSFRHCSERACYSGCNEYLVTLAVRHKSQWSMDHLLLKIKVMHYLKHCRHFIQFSITFQRTGVFHYNAVKTTETWCT
jgi:hypothetical protein